MMRFLPDAAVALLVLISLGWGGHAPWSMFALELGASVLLLCVLLSVLWTNDPETSWRKIPPGTGYRGLASLVRVLSLGLLPWGRKAAAIEMLPAGRQLPAPDEDVDSCGIAGYRFPRARVAVPLFFLTLWIAASLLPLPGDWLRSLSPRALSIRAASESLLRFETVTAWTWSLAPFLTERALCLWTAYLALFYVGVSLAADPKRVRRLSGLLFMAAVAAGSYGVWQWFSGLRDLLVVAPSLSGTRASGPFGNPNHYAAAMEILLLCSAGWMGARLMQVAGDSMPGLLSRARGLQQESVAKFALMGLGMIAAALGLIFSLSRSGITATVAALGVFALLGSSRLGASRADVIELKRHPGEASARAPREAGACRVWAFSFCLAAITIWIGMGPLVQRFGGVSTVWEVEKGRQQVWLDSLGAVRDFWLTGSGLGSYQHVFPIYRTFGGDQSYAYAHNDYLQLLIELGLPGVLLVSWLGVAVCLAARRARRRLRDDVASLHLHAGYCAAAFAIALHSFTDFSLHLPANAALLSVVLGVVVGFDRERDAAKRISLARGPVG